MVLEDIIFLLLHFFPVHHISTPSIFVFTRPNDGWTGLYIKLWRDYFPTESLYHLLLDLSTVPVHLSSQQLEVNLTSLACACLLSLVVARGDTSEILGAVAGLLMSPSSLATQMVEVRLPARWHVPFTYKSSKLYTPPLFCNQRSSALCLILQTSLDSAVIG